MRLRLLAAGLVPLLLAGCQPHFSKMNWEPIVPSPQFPVEMALARCQLASSSVDQGYIAVGSAEFVAGAGIGNAIANDMRRNDFVIHCMTIHGWRGVPQKPR